MLNVFFGNPVAGGTAFSTTLTEALVLADVLTKLTGKSLVDTTALVDSLPKDTTRILTEQLVLADVVEKLTGRTLSDAVTLQDTVTASLLRFADLTDAVGLVDSLTKAMNRTFIEEVTLVDGRTVSVGRVLTDALTLTDARSMSLTRALAESIALQDSVTAIKVVIKELTEQLSLADTAARITIKNLAETIALADQRSVAITRSLTDAVVIADAVTKSTVIAPLVEVVGLSDAVNKATGRVVNEILGLADVLATQLQATKIFAEALALDDVQRRHVIRVFVDAITALDSIVNTTTVWVSKASPNDRFATTLQKAYGTSLVGPNSTTLGSA